MESVYKTEQVGMNASRLSEATVELVSIGTEQKVTRQPERETMLGRTPDLTGPLPQIP